MHNIIREIIPKYSYICLNFKQTKKIKAEMVILGHFWLFLCKLA